MWKQEHFPKEKPPLPGVCVPPDPLPWKEESFDDLIPEGFLSDFIYHTRGVETPTQLSLWTGLWLLSSILKRESVFQWHPEMALYPNLYVILVGPPKIVAKSTAIGFAERILLGMENHYQSKILRWVKHPNLLRSKATPEALGVALEPKDNETVWDENDKVHVLDKGSELLLAVSELSTFLGKQKYNEGLIDFLTHLYDCKDDDDVTTIARGHTHFRNVYVNLIGATTKQHLEESLPEAAFGGGFLSRTSIIYQPTSTRDYPFPMRFPGAPTLEDMQKKAAWVGWNSLGTFTMTPLAEEYYVEWYYRFKTSLAKRHNDQSAMLEHRRDLHMLKIAMLLRAAEYRPGRDIDFTHIQTADKLITTSLTLSANSLEGIGVSEYNRHLQQVLEIIQKKKRATRRQILTSMSKYLDADTLTRIMDQLVQQESVKAYYNRKPVIKPTRRGEEYYVPHDRRVGNGK